MSVEPIKASQNHESKTTSRDHVHQNAANEFFFAVVGHVGSGTSNVAQVLSNILSDEKLAGGPFDVDIIKARDIIDKTIPHQKKEEINKLRSIKNVENYQDFGDKLRSQRNDHAAIARGLIHRIREIRGRKIGKDSGSEDTIIPDGTRRAYILDSLRHPSEVMLLRKIYKDAFVLVGVVCEESKRKHRLQEKYYDGSRKEIEIFMERDAKASQPYGQKVSKAFHLADFFVDNTENRLKDDGSSNPYWSVTDELSRLITLITHSNIVRPRSAETAMENAYAAQMRSACLSRQVGAAITDQDGNVVATGTNEVPQAGGGVYGEGENDKDDRCAYRRTEDFRFCSNIREQNDIINRIIESIPELDKQDPQRKASLRIEMRETPVGELLEFSRAVHAEMDALLTAGRKRVSTVAAKVYVTTFPCHYCARHLVASGVDEVQYIEPYPKSRALHLHDDSIAVEASEWQPPSGGGSRVLFRPFSGVAPRMYRRAFLKDRPLKNDTTGDLAIGQPEWETPWYLAKASYVELETKLIKDDEKTK